MYSMESLGDIKDAICPTTLNRDRQEIKHRIMDKILFYITIWICNSESESFEIEKG